MSLKGKINGQTVNQALLGDFDPRQHWTPFKDGPSEFGQLSVKIDDFIPPVYMPIQ